MHILLFVCNFTARHDAAHLDKSHLKMSLLPSVGLPGEIMTLYFWGVTGQ